MRLAALLAAAAVALAYGPAAAVPVDVGSASQFTINPDNAVVSVTLNDALSTYADQTHPYLPFTGLGHSIGHLAFGGDGSVPKMLNMGEPHGIYAHSTATLGFASPIINGPGVDLYLFESGYTAAPDTLSISLDGAGYWYETPLDFAPMYATKHYGHDTFAGYFTYGYDLSDLGLAPGASVSDIRVGNFDQFATVTGGDGTGYNGWVDPTHLAGVPVLGGNGSRFLGSSITFELLGTTFTMPVTVPPPPGANSYYFTGPSFPTTAFWAPSDTDPDVFYAAAAGAVVPEPSTLGLLSLGGLLALRRRRRG